MKKYEIDKLIKEEGYHDASFLLRRKLPKMVAKLNRLDKKIISLLNEIREAFPEAEYYTASGGFNLLLGPSHDDYNEFGKQTIGNSQAQRIAWSGNACIEDGDF